MNTRYLTLAIFVTATLAALAGLAWTLGALPKAGHHYRLHLDDAGGLVEGNAVRIAGCRSGRSRRSGSTATERCSSCVSTRRCRSSPRRAHHRR
ncbi:hypothetical protein [Nannocystis pusilla]|uniref:hypothetical protein n=1 Tax=Nannocystis pusilla TaxID=889268 RepID=UPI003B7D510E